MFPADGGKRGTDKAASFLVERPEVDGSRGFFALLAGLERRRDPCVIRGAPGRWFPADGDPVHRLLHPQPAYADARGRRVTAEEVRKFGREPRSARPSSRRRPADVRRGAHAVAPRSTSTGRVRARLARRLAETAAWLRCGSPDALPRRLVLVPGHRQRGRPDQAGPRRLRRPHAARLRPVPPPQPGPARGVAGRRPRARPLHVPHRPGNLRRPARVRGRARRPDADPFGRARGVEDLVEVPDGLPGASGGGRARLRPGRERDGRR